MAAPASVIDVISTSASTNVISTYTSASTKNIMIGVTNLMSTRDFIITSTSTPNLTSTSTNTTTTGLPAQNAEGNNYNDACSYL